MCIVVMPRVVRSTVSLVDSGQQQHRPKTMVPGTLTTTLVNFSQTIISQRFGFTERLCAKRHKTPETLVQLLFASIQSWYVATGSNQFKQVRKQKHFGLGQEIRCECLAVARTMADLIFFHLCSTSSLRHCLVSVAKVGTRQSASFAFVPSMFFLLC